jgi:hypothetical protein
MRIYTMADRNRDEFKARIDVSPGERFNFGVDTSVTSDDYFNSIIGLLNGRFLVHGLRCSWMISDKASATCYASHELIESRQANAEQLAPSPLWTGENNDTIDTAGVGFKYSVDEKFDSRPRLHLRAIEWRDRDQQRHGGIPDLETRLNSARLYVNFAAGKKLSLRLSYWYEDYRSDDWALDGVAPATISNVLAFGQQSPDYKVNVIALSGRYEF